MYAAESAALNEEVWIWGHSDGIHVVAAGRGSDHVVLSAREARRVAYRLLNLSRTCDEDA